MNDLTVECEKLLRENIVSAYIYKTFDILQISENAVCLSDNVTLQGCDISKHLHDCEKTVLLGATLGQGVDSLIRKMQVADMAKAVTIDGLACVEIEKILDNVTEKIKLKYPNLTTRYSPGYGDFPLETQKTFSVLLNLQKTTGIFVADNNMLIPSKSVTAVIGVKEK